MVVPPLHPGAFRHSAFRGIPSARIDLTRSPDHRPTGDPREEKQALRRRLRAARRDHVAALPDRVRALMFHRPPGPLERLVPDGAAIGLYSAHGAEAPTAGYARFFHEKGHRIALPRFAGREAEMQFAAWADPLADDALEPGPFGAAQPVMDAARIVPDMLFVPLVGFTRDGVRLGQGGGHYDRWLAAHPDTRAIGMAWDCQLTDAIPVEAHDRPLAAVVTPARLYGPFA